MAFKAVRGPNPPRLWLGSIPVRDVPAAQISGYGASVDLWKTGTVTTCLIVIILLGPVRRYIARQDPPSYVPVSFLYLLAILTPVEGCQQPPWIDH